MAPRRNPGSRRWPARWLRSGEPETGVPPTENFNFHNSAFDDSITLDDNHSLACLASVAGDRVEFDAALWDKNADAYSEDGTTPVCPERLN